MDYSCYPANGSVGRTQNVTFNGGLSSDQVNTPKKTITTPFRSESLHAKRCSRASDTSSAYSGSDVMQSSLDDLDVDTSELADSENEEGFTESTNNSLIVRDRVRECLEKDPVQRTEYDIEILLEFMQHMPAFSNMTLSMRRALCSVMVFASIDKTDTVVLADGEELDSWSVVLNGHVEIARPDGSIEHLHMGDCFGVTPSQEKTYQNGIMRTKVDDCQFVCIAKNDYHQILHQGEESIVRIEERGEVCLVLENRKIEEGKQGHVVLRGSPDKLTCHLVENNSADPTYVEDFLLTYRTFLKSPQDVANKLLSWFHDQAVREKVARIVLLWVNSHFQDFDEDPQMSEFLEKFELFLKSQKMVGHLRLLNMAYSARARPRSVVLSRATRDEILLFSIVGGQEKGVGIFITKVEKGSKASEVGLKRGDQILEVNNQSFESITHERAIQILRGSTHLAITVKSNFYAFREFLHLHDETSSTRHRDTSVPRQPSDSKPSSPGCTAAEVQSNSAKAVDVGAKEKSLSSPVQTSKIRKALLRFSFLQKAESSDMHTTFDLDECSVSRSSSRKSSLLSENSNLGQHLSASNPDLTSSGHFEDQLQDLPEHVIKVFRADQSFRYLLVHKETTSREVVMLSLTEFGMSDASCNYSLYEVSFEDQGFVKTKLLSDQLNNLADRCRVNSRYYLRNNKNMELLVPEEMVTGIVRDCQVNLLQLHSLEVAEQLTLRDFELFKKIEASEYINDLFDLNVKGGRENLSRFSEMVNQEMFWVVTEVCTEQNVLKRMKIIKQFIKIAKHCQLMRNFNSMFALLSGLGHGSVSRLRQTWEKLPAKYLKFFEEMQDIMDPSRNMAKYRNLLSAHVAHPPVIPFFPLIKKDLTFIHFGNDSRVDGLVNFEKLRMVSKEVHFVTSLATGTYLNKSGSFKISCYSSSQSAVTTFRRKKNAPINPKRMYEEALMTRKVKSYLSGMKVVIDETELDHMSQQCEPSVKPNNKKLLVHAESSASSSQSSLHSDNSVSSVVNAPMFGTESSDAIHKLMSLSDKSRVRSDSKHKVKVSTSSVSSKPAKLRPVDLSSESSSLVFPHQKSRMNGSPSLDSCRTCSSDVSSRNSQHFSIASSSSDSQSSISSCDQIHSMLTEAAIIPNGSTNHSLYLPSFPGWTNNRSYCYNNIFSTRGSRPMQPTLRYVPPPTPVWQLPNSDTRPTKQPCQRDVQKGAWLGYQGCLKGCKQQEFPVELRHCNCRPLPPDYQSATRMLMERQSRKPVQPKSSCRQRSHSCEGILDSGDIYIADAESSSDEDDRLVSLV